MQGPNSSDLFAGMKLERIYRSNSRAATKKIDPAQILSLAVWLIDFLLSKLAWVLENREGEGKTDSVPPT